MQPLSFQPHQPLEASGLSPSSNKGRNSSTLSPSVKNIAKLIGICALAFFAYRWTNEQLAREVPVSSPTRSPSPSPKPLQNVYVTTAGIHGCQKAPSDNNLIACSNERFRDLYLEKKPVSTQDESQFLLFSALLAKENYPKALKTLSKVTSYSDKLVYSYEQLDDQLLACFNTTYQTNLTQSLEFLPQMTFRSSIEQSSSKLVQLELSPENAKAILATDSQIGKERFLTTDILAYHLRKNQFAQAQEIIATLEDKKDLAMHSYLIICKKHFEQKAYKEIKTLLSSITDEKIASTVSMYLVPFYLESDLPEQALDIASFITEPPEKDTLLVTIFAYYLKEQLHDQAMNTLSLIQNQEIKDANYLTLVLVYSNKNQTTNILNLLPTIPQLKSDEATAILIHSLLKTRDNTTEIETQDRLLVEAEQRASQIKNPQYQSSVYQVLLVQYLKQHDLLKAEVASTKIDSRYIEKPETLFKAYAQVNAAPHAILEGQEKIVDKMETGLKNAHYDLLREGYLTLGDTVNAERIQSKIVNVVNVYEDEAACNEAYAASKTASKINECSKIADAILDTKAYSEIYYSPTICQIFLKEQPGTPVIRFRKAGDKFTSSMKIEKEREQYFAKK